MINSRSQWDFIKDAFSRLEHRVSRLEQVEIPFPQVVSIGTSGHARNLTLTTDWQNILDFDSTMGIPYGLYMWQVNFIFRSSAADAGFLAEGAIFVNGAVLPYQPDRTVVTLLEPISGNDTYVTVSQSWSVYAANQTGSTEVKMCARKSGGSGNSSLDARTTFYAIGERFRPDEV